MNHASKLTDSPMHEGGSVPTSNTLGLDRLQKAARDIIAKKFIQGSYRSSLYACEGCGGELFIPLAREDRYHIPTVFSLCSTCALVACNPRLHEASREDFYINHYTDLLYGEREEEERFEKVRIERGSLLQRVLHNMHGILPGDTILDIGCGSGGVVADLRARGYNAIGIDPHEPSLRYGRDTLNLPLYTGTIKDAPRILQHPPKIMLYMFSLEYIQKIKEEFAMVRGFLSDDGYLIVFGIRLEKSIVSRASLTMSLRFYLIHIFGIAQIKRIALAQGLRLVYHNQGWRSWLRRPENHSTFIFRKTSPNVIAPNPRWAPTVLRRLRRIEQCRRVVRAIRRFVAKGAKSTVHRCAAFSPGATLGIALNSPDAALSSRYTYEK
jgi:SAM-dependent methyltransferase